MKIRFLGLLTFFLFLSALIGQTALFPGTARPQHLDTI
jgi:hypothetical protein